MKFAAYYDRTPKKIFIPEFQKLTYLLNNNTGYYELSVCPVGFSKLPTELKVEPTHDPKIQANNIIRGRIKNKEYLFFTGLRNTAKERLFEGNNYQNRVREWVLFEFSVNAQQLTVYYFNGFYPKGTLATQLIKSIF